MSTPTTPGIRRQRIRRRVKVIVATFLVLLLLAGAAVWKFGPRYGVYLVPPSPAAYADAALGIMDGGYYATGESWRTARAQAVADTRDAKSYVETIPALRRAVVVAGGHHSKVMDSGKGLDEAMPQRPLPTLRSAGGITTVVVPEQAVSDKAFKQTYADTLANGIASSRTATTCGWIVDLRHNHGGDMGPMLAGLSALLPDGNLVGFKDRSGTVVWETLEGGTVSQGGQVSMAVADAAKLSQPIAVLQGPDNGSSGEATVLAFRGLGHARSFGAPTAGYSSANQVRSLYDGTQILITTAVDVDRTGKTWNGGPVPPEQSADVDTAHKTAATWLNTQCHR